MLKKLMIGTSITLGTAAVVAGATVTTLYFTKWKKAQDEQAKLTDKENFEKAVNASAFVKPTVFTLDIAENDNQIMAIINTIKYKWSGSADPIKIHGSGPGYVVNLNKNTNTYTKNIFSKVWKDIMDEVDNKDFKNIKQVSYGFQIFKTNETYYLRPQYVQFSFNEKPSWLEKEDSFRVALYTNKDLLSTINIIKS